MSFIASNLVRFEEYEIDRGRWQLTWRDEPITLNRKTFDLLLFLVDHSDRVVGKDELLSALWPESFVEESNLAQHIFLLRKALSRHESGAKIVQTVAGRGYRFAAEVAEIAVVSKAEGQPVRSESVSSLTMQATQTRVVMRREVEERSSWYLTRGGVLAILAVLMVAATIGWKGWQRWLDRSGGSPVQLVLMPMEGTTGDPVLDKALTQAMRMDLAQSPYVSLLPIATLQATLTQMMHKPDDVMSLAMAREACERTNSQSVLSGNIARIGQHFLITEEASSCVDGSAVASAKYEADSAEDLPHGIDELAASLRQKLGESRRSIARFNAPLFAVNTVSLDALKNYSQASALAARGNFADAISLQKKALAIDPKFTAAQYDLAGDYISTGDFVNGRAELVKAYAMRDLASEPVRLSINALYDTYSTQDLDAAERNYRSWIELYPQSVQAWNGLSVVLRELGRNAESAASGLRALSLRPDNQGLYANAAYEQRRSGDVQGARATLDRAIAHNLDGDRIRTNYLANAIFFDDPKLVEAQQQWVDAHPQAVYSRIEEVEAFNGAGRFEDAHRLLEQVVLLLHHQGLAQLADTLTKVEGINLVEAGDKDAGLRLFHSVPVDAESGSDLVGLAETGDGKAALADLQAMRAKYPQGTLWNLYWGPQIEAHAALANHQPRQAAARMETARPLDGRNSGLPRLRGDAYLAGGQPALAEKEYRAAVTHREIDAQSGDYTLSWLGLGRALAAQGKCAAAIDAYQHFLILWGRADPDATYLREAKQELVLQRTHCEIAN